MNEKEKEKTEEKKEQDRKARREILERTGREYFLSGEDELSKGRCNSAVVLFFKSMASFADFYLFNETGTAPSSHSDRFRMTQKKFSEVYDLLDKNFPHYQESYNKIMLKELAEAIKNDAKTMAEKAKINL